MHIQLCNKFRGTCTVLSLHNIVCSCFPCMKIPTAFLITCITSTVLSGIFTLFRESTTQICFIRQCFCVLCCSFICTTLFIIILLFLLGLYNYFIIIVMHYDYHRLYFNYYHHYSFINYCIPEYFIHLFYAFNLFQNKPMTVFSVLSCIFNKIIVGGIFQEDLSLYLLFA